MAFTGWPGAAVEFYVGLEADNSKAYWTANRATYEAAVRAPMLELAEAVAGEFGPFHVFRPYRDVRFSRDRSPYKTNIGAVTEGEGGEVYYVGLSATGLVAASGYYHLAPDQLERYRAAVDDDRHGARVLELVTGLEADGYDIGAADALKTAPRGFSRDHPRVRLLRLKGLTAGRTFEPGPWLSAPGALERITETWRGCAELNRWLNEQVGPSRLAPAEAEGW
jgi:uncharacterized protein (TIGR02453 family)